MSISLRKLKNSEDDYLKLYNWCKKKYIYEWFEQRKLSYDEIVDKYKNKLIEKKQDLYIIKKDEMDIGFVQIYRCDLKIDNYKNIYEYDLFIGEEEYLGIGNKVVDEINTFIYREYKADSIVLRPFKRNIRALKCYEKCNFKCLYEYEDKNTIGEKEVIVVMINEGEGIL